ncbi:hypothetical protein [Jatrophihabitans sp.]|uniref:hypothetical protein n=1 Tax=Jatrophihabitans sp. TaxID=1932789 RepID=UPI0030C69599|nr:cell wall anchor protein [Jatrophihabitans sp.]
MSVLKRLGAASIVLVAMIAAALSFGGGASAYTVGNNPTLSGSASSAPAGGEIEITGSGYTPNTDAAVSFHSTPVSLGTVAVNSAGAFDITVKIPSDATVGLHHIEGTDAVTGAVGSFAVTVTGAGTGTSGGGGIASTGVAVIGIGALGTVLLVGGGLMLMAGRRRKVIA